MNNKLLTDKLIYDYWLKKLEGDHAVLPAPVLRTRLQVQRAVTPGLYAKLQHIGKNQPLSFLTLALTSYRFLLSRYFKGGNFPIVSPTLENTNDNDKRMFFSAKDPAGLSFKESVIEQQQDVQTACKYDGFSWAELLERMKRKSINADALFVFGISYDPLHRNKNTRTDFELILNEHEGGLNVTLSDHGLLSDEQTACFFLESWIEQLRRFAENTSYDPYKDGALSAAEKEFLLAQSGSFHAVNYESVWSLIIQSASAHKNSPALSCGNLQLDYSEFINEVDLFAAGLQRYITPGSVVAIHLTRSEKIVIALLAILRCGGIYVGIETTYPDERKAYIASDNNASLILDDTGDPLLWSTTNTLDYKSCRDNTVQFRPTEILPADTAYLMYTSGSTGRPKGVQVNHRSLHNFLISMRELPGIGHTDIVVSTTSYGFDISLLEFLLPLCSGASLIIATEEERNDPEQLSELLYSTGCTFYQCTPSQWRILIDCGWQGNPGMKALSGGERLPENLALHLLKKVGSLWNMYGPTETTIWSVCAKMDEERVKASVIGFPIGNTQLRVLDEYDNLAGVGIPGELYIGGSGVAQGYLNRTEETTQRFVELVAGVRYYKSGDIVYWNNKGELVYVGRNDEQVKIRGHRIEPGEIENKIYNCAGIKQACVLPVGEESDKRLVAFACGAGLDKEQLHKELSQWLPAYMLPSEYVLLNELPVNSSGKVDRKRLVELYILESHNAVPQQEHALSATEQALWKIWEEVLGKPPQNSHANFFTSGGNSLKAMQIVSRIQRDLHKRVSFVNIFNYFSIHELAQHTEKLPVETLALLKRAPAADDYPLSQAQLGIWLFCQSQKDQLVYVNSGAYLFTGKLNTEALSRAVHFVVERHECLRTVFTINAGMPRQRISRLAPENYFKIVDLQDHASAEIRLAELLEENKLKCTSLEEGPLFNCVLAVQSANQNVFGFALHHIISDEWSSELIAHDLLSAYNSFSMGEFPAMTPLRIQYKDYAFWEQLPETRRQNEKLLLFWEEQLKAIPSAINLPYDYPVTPETGYDAEIIRLVLPANVTAWLYTQAEHQQTTLFSVLLAGMNAWLYAITGQTDIVIGTPTDLRTRAELEKQAGIYLNMLVLRSRLSLNTTVEELFAGTNQTVLESFGHHEYLFNKLITQLKAAPRPGRNPFFDVGFTLHNVEALSSVPEHQFANSIKIEPLVQDKFKIKADLWIDAHEVGDFIHLYFFYRRDLFGNVTGKAMAQTLQYAYELLATINTGTLEEVSKNIKHFFNTVKSMDQQEKKDKNLEKFFKAKAKTVSLNENATTHRSQPFGNFPVVYEPVMQGLDLAYWIKQHRTEIEQELHTHGAVLFRGFGIKDQATFLNVSKSWSDNSVEYTDRSSPRTRIGEAIYTSTEHPADQPIMMHNELSYSHQWPKQIAFCCINAPVEGGETPIADSRKVYQQLSAGLKEKAQNGICYERNLVDGVGLSWREVYQTDSRDEAEAYCKKNNISFEWVDEKQLRISWKRPAVINHPVSGDAVWFNHGFFFNPVNLEPELYKALTRENSLPFNTSFGNGELFSVEDMAEIRQAYEQERILIKWQEGDFLLVDNLLMAHGREPFKGPRKILVSMFNAMSI
jgi:amino acid adenylation domain-containing protein